MFEYSKSSHFQKWCYQQYNNLVHMPWLLTLTFVHCLRVAPLVSAFPEVHGFRAWEELQAPTKQI